MRKTIIALLAAAALPMLAQAPAAPVYPRASQKSVLTQTIGMTDITIIYSRPGVKGRKIWGDLVPYGKVWRTGANEATEIAFSDDVMVNGQPLPKATYSLHTIPGETEWTVIFNKVNNQWGSFSYDEKQDALRIKVKPRQSGEFHEWMTFEIPELSSDSATIEMAWEKLEVPFTVTTNTTAKVVSVANAAIAAAKPDDWRTAFTAANYAFNNKMDADAAKWLDASLKTKETIQNLWLKAQMQARAGNKAEAIKTGEKALTLKTDKDTALAQTVSDAVAGWKK
jgi:hypothetical protein